MTSAIDWTRHYADFTQSWIQPRFDNQSTLGTGCFTTAFGTGSCILYSPGVAKQIALNLHRTHTGVDLAINGPVLWVYGNQIPSVETNVGSYQMDAFTRERTAETEFISVADTLRAIRFSFNLTVPQLAEVMRVERRMIYAWISNNGMDSMQEGRRARLNLLYRIASKWASKAPLYGNFLHEGFPETGLTVYDLLTADQINPAAFDFAYDKLIAIKSSEDRRIAHVEEQRSKNMAIGIALKSAFKTLGA